MPNDTHILFAWIGGSDRNAAGIPRDGTAASAPERPARNDKPDGPGPIARTLLFNNNVVYTKAVLLSDKPDKDKLYKAWLDGELKARGMSPVPEICLVTYQGNAMDRGSVYEASRQAVDAHARYVEDSPVHRTYILSSGTAVMHLCWTLLAHTHTYAARMVEPFLVRENNKFREGVDVIEPWIPLKQTFPKPPRYSLDELYAEEYKTAKYESQQAKEIIGIPEEIAQAVKIGTMTREWLVLILGETGTGKEAIAKIIHEIDMKYRERHGKFIPVNCGAIPKDVAESELFGHEKGSFTSAHERRVGYIELAKGGTLFLDEVGELTLDLQVKLLRFLENKSYFRVGGTNLLKVDDVRIVAATNRDLMMETRKGRFRGDLYYRLDDGITIRLPPLRARKKDIKLIADRYKEKLNKEIRGGDGNVGIAEEVYGLLMKYPWPGNVRELQNVIKKAYFEVCGMQNALITERVIKKIIGDTESWQEKSFLTDADIFAEHMLNENTNNINKQESQVVINEFDKTTRDIQRQELDAEHSELQIKYECIEQALEKSGYNQTGAERLIGKGAKFINTWVIKDDRFENYLIKYKEQGRFPRIERLIEISKNRKAQRDKK